MPDILELQEFFVEGNSQEKSHVLLHITEPSSAEERKKGYFFALAEINNGTMEQIEHMQQMIDDLESGYYETDETLEKNAFETTLEYINRRGHHLLQYKNSAINCLVGVLRNHEIFFAYHGLPQAFLFYKNKEGILEQIDIMDGQEQGENEDYLFSAIIQGNVNIGDYFYITTPHTSDFFTHDRIKKIVGTRNIKQSTEHIQKVLNDLNSSLSFGGIIMHYPKEMPMTGKSSIYLKKGSDASINQMLAREKNTREIMSPPFLGNLKKRINKFKKERPKNKQEKIIENKKLLSKKRGVIETNFRPRQKQESIVNTIMVTIGKTIVMGVVGLSKLLKKIALTTVRGLIMIILLITNKDNKRRDVIKNIKNNIDEKKEKFYELPMSSKILFFSSIILVVVFFVSIGVFKIKENTAVKKQTYINYVQAVIDKKNAADASIIYGDNKRALDLLQEAKNIIVELPNEKKEEKDKISELTNNIDSVLLKLQKLSTIEPEIIFDLTEINPEAQAEQLVKIDNTLIAFGKNDKLFYKINLLDNTKESKEHSNISNLLHSSAPKEDDMIIFVSGDDTIAQYNKESSLVSEKNIAYPNNNVKLADIFIYNRRLYSLDPSNNQIYRHSQTQTGYDKGVVWLKDNLVDIKDSVSLAVDGDLFVLKQNGEIVKLTGGQKEDFTITGLNPALGNPTKIWTYNGLDNIYVLEPTNRRVVVLDKQGKMLNQYTAITWQNPTDMVVEEENKIIYVLDSNKVYKFGL
ncbi:hypothetical protein KJ785_03130 [Patescibacteria group bacterium]|nr:hypothetical protein [Patescibacteria group bacterium]